MTGGKALSGVEEKTFPEQKVFDGKPFPLVLVPRADSGKFGNITETVEWVRNQKAALENELLENGAVMFRGFPIVEPIDFDRFVKAFEYSPLPYVGGAAPRTNVVGDVFTSNEAPPDQLIPFHHEMAQVPTYPSKLFFFCQLAPPEGGQTPLAPSTRVYGEMAARHPEFVAELERQGVRYTRVLPDGDDPSSPIGRGWQSTFQTQDRAQAERKCREQGTEFQWLPDGCLKTITAVLPAVRTYDRKGKKVWFNSVIAAYRGWKDCRNTPEKAVTFADGSPMPADVMDDLDRVFDEVSVAMTWQPGDVVMIDNNQVLHARRSFTPPRRVLACLIK